MFVSRSRVPSPCNKNNRSSQESKRLFYLYISLQIYSAQPTGDQPSNQRPGMLAPPLRRGVALPLLYVKQYKPDPWACQDYFLFSCQDRTPNQKYMSPRAPGGILLSPPPLQAHR